MKLNTKYYRERVLLPCKSSCAFAFRTPPYQIFSESSTIYKLISIDSDLTVIVTDDSPVVAIDYHYR